MDIEKQVRQELTAGLGSGFRCYEEVNLRHALFKDVRVRADLIGYPINNELDGFVFAFEVKRPSKEWGYGDWNSHIRQAHDYMYARVDDNRYPDILGKVVSCCFL